MYAYVLTSFVLGAVGNFFSLILLVLSTSATDRIVKIIQFLLGTAFMAWAAKLLWF